MNINEQHSITLSNKKQHMKKIKSDTENSGQWNIEVSWHTAVFGISHYHMLKIWKHKDWKQQCNHQS